MSAGASWFGAFPTDVSQSYRAMLDWHELKRDMLAETLRQETTAEVRFDPYSRALYSTDASIYQIEPVGVVIPRTLADVEKTVNICADQEVPILPRGAGTSLSGQSVGPAVVVDFSKYLNQILRLDPQQRVARVQPGVVLDDLNAAAKPFALQFGPDVATSDRANLGGMIGNNSAGARSIVYGKTVDHVRELSVLLADGTAKRFGPLSSVELDRKQRLQDREGEIYRTVVRVVAQNRDEIERRYPKILRRVSGYNLDEFLPDFNAHHAPRIVPAALEPRIGHAPESPHPPASFLNAQLPTGSRPFPFNLSKLVVGSEGTLVTVTEAVVNLIPLPRERGLMVLHFDRLESALDTVGTILACNPSAVELIDHLILKLAAQNLQYSRYLDFVAGSPDAILIVEFSADTKPEIDDRIRELAAKLDRAQGIGEIIRANDPELRDHIWRCRKAAVPLLLGIPGDAKPIPFVEDTAVSPERLPDFIRRFREILAKHDTVGSFYGHASVGCLHVRPLVDLKRPEGIAKLREIAADVSDLVLEFGGAMSGEHGDGLARSIWNQKLFGPRIYAAFHEIKTAFDPKGLMNPGKIVDAPDLTQNLRTDPRSPIVAGNTTTGGAAAARHPAMSVPTVLDFSKEGGLTRAVELCNGSGVCRKLRSGTMCPSYMVTREEEHSTRGRANLLRLILNGALPPAELTSRRLYGAMDLCIMCKGCKADCPSNVDMAKLKAEFLHHYYQRHPMPVSSHLWARVAWLNRLGSATAPLSNWISRQPLAKRLLHKLAGIDQRRALPTFHRNHLRRWFGRRSAHLNAGQRGTVILLDDCFTTYNCPDVGRAAVELLERAGYGVKLAGLPCCGRPMVSKGLLTAAKGLARDNLRTMIDLLDGAGGRGPAVAIVGCEPSCLSMLWDEYPALAPGKAADRLAASSHLVEQWLAQLSSSGKLTLRFRDRPEELLFHGHCQQKALVGSHRSLAALRMIPGLKVEEIDSGCCGMAGSFGYETEHYDISLAMGQRALFPAVTAAPHATLVAPGFSCRSQLADALGRPASHPVEILRAQLSDDTIALQAAESSPSAAADKSH